MVDSIIIGFFRCDVLCEWLFLKTSSRNFHRLGWYITEPILSVVTLPPCLCITFRCHWAHKASYQWHSLKVVVCRSHNRTPSSACMHSGQTHHLYIPLVGHFLLRVGLWKKQQNHGEVLLLAWFIMPFYALIYRVFGSFNNITFQFLTCFVYFCR